VPHAINRDEERSGIMKSQRDAFGRGCLLASLVALYVLLGMKAFVVWREGLWLDWPLGDYLPDGLVRWVFALPDSQVRSVAAWLLGQDVLYHAAAISLVLWLCAFSGESPGVDDDKRVAR
jgi:hypothetical protein